jgi:murein DD-endopeptidase MepM/ murein hydrolase activator NlpD
MGGADKAYKHCENYVAVKHDDGTYGLYLHLKHDGVLVKLGQAVKEGDALALPGQTGWATEPHLHFCVIRISNGQTRYSIPFKVRTDEGILNKLEPAQAY